MLYYMEQRKKKQSGFTLVEILITTAILICLLAISFVEVPKFLRHIQVTERDAAAKEIYMAAQNRAILLSGSGELEHYVIQGDSNKLEHVDVTPGSADTVQITAYYINSKDTNIDELLPEKNIESSLWEGSFYIVYEPVSGSVTDVFFVKENEIPLDSGGFAAFYEKWRAAPREDRMKNDPIIGYYGGDSAQSGTSLSLRTPVVNIYNEDVLRAEVTYWVPRTLAMINNDMLTEENFGGVELEVELSYQKETVPLALRDRAVKEDFEYFAVTYTWELDSLEEGKQFKDLFENPMSTVTMGDDFTITAAVSYEGNTSMQEVNGARKSATDNSLFAKGSGEDTAYIGYMRHLQNLDSEFSEVTGKSNAEQITDITCQKEYSFIPIENAALRNYNGKNYQIRDLHVDTADTAGLFGAVSSMEFSDMRLVNAEVKGGDNVGVLVGDATNSTIHNCQVYWEKVSADKNNLRDVLGDSEKGIEYQVNGDTVGGLAGRMNGGSISDSFAATTIDGQTVGGLIGAASDVKISDSYGDNYLHGKEAAGLIGNLSGNGTVTDCYATGFIKSKDNGTAAGFSLGNGSITTDRAYSTVLFTQDATNYPIHQGEESCTNTYYLPSAFLAEKNTDATAKSYEELTDGTKLTEFYGAGHHFEMKNAQNTNPYNLQTTLTLTNYSYPGLAGMTHYGDWGAEFQNGSLVYFEKYQNSNEISYAFNGGNLALVTDDKYAVEDGYAVAFLSTEILAQNGATIEVTYMNDRGEQVTEKVTYKPEDLRLVTYHNETTQKDEQYYLLPLPGNIVNTKYAAEDFYQEISFSQSGQEQKNTGHYYYNPHFANAVLPYEEELDLAKLADGLMAEIRTPRHLYMLSEHSEYFSSNHDYNFTQTMNIDYNIYVGYDLFKADGEGHRVAFQSPIGENASRPFRGNYYGQCHTIENVGIKANGNYVGLFGYSIGNIEDAVYFVNEKTVGEISSRRSLGTVYTGGLVGYNGGIIENCAVAGMEIKLYAYAFSTVYTGGLAGWNRGTIRDCSAALTGLTAEANLSNAYVGGFIGQNDAGGSIERCYAVGNVHVERSRYGDVVAGGFAGSNSGTLTQSYAATNLQVSGGAVAYGFCMDKTENTYYMNEGNFYYNGVNYTAQYKDSFAEGRFWEDFVNTDEITEGYLSTKLGMSVPGATKAHELTMGSFYPYPGAVKDAGGEYIHYGHWPVMMDLRDGGIYYWEKMVMGGEESYHLSAIAVDPDLKTVGKVETLSTGHGDGGVITEYGYGYYDAVGKQKNSLSSMDICYEGTSNPDKPLETKGWVENEKCDEELAKLLDGKYTFHSYNTWKTGNDGNGLYIDSEDANPYGIWTLTLGDKQGKQVPVDFYVNPFFAGSLAVKDLPEGWTNSEESVPTEMLGETEEFPFQVRSVEQLQFINWNTENKNTNTVLTNDSSKDFLFLGYKGNDRDYFWLQTHDLQGNKDKTYTPIAELYDAKNSQDVTVGTLFGWFGGAYDGDAYVIQDVNVKGQISSCTGLFGMVYNGTLKNIIMYSPDGKGTITAGSSGRNDATNEKGSAWYAIGGLAAFAATGSGYDGSAIENCAIAGYTIQDDHTGGGEWGGTCMGGLVGVSCMDLKNCTAVTNLITDVRDNDNVRIGGLVGSCQKSISSCYAGGNIDVKSSVTVGQDHGIYVGGIVGGLYFKPLTGPDGRTIGDKTMLTNTLRNCYSFVTLPNVSVHDRIRALYAVGGPGELSRARVTPHFTQGLSDTGYTTYENCYYLQEVVWKNNGGEAPKDATRTDAWVQWREGTTGGGYNTPSDYEPAWHYWPAGFEWMATEKKLNDNVKALGYAQMSDGTLLNSLNAKGGGFATVTKETTSGYPINGKYSFTSDPSLTGQNYPFPTILTQEANSGRVNVHYGGWPVVGLYRESGSIPMDIDLFADHKGGSASKTENILLSDLIETGGTLRCELLDVDGNPLSAGETSPVTVAFAENGFATGRKTALTLTGNRVGSGQVKVIYTVGGTEYTVMIEFQVTAELQLLAQTIRPTVFTSETASVLLEMRDKNGAVLNDALRQQIKLEQLTAERDDLYLSDAAIAAEETGAIPLMMTSKDLTGTTKITARFAYTYLDTSYEASNPISIQIHDPEIKLTPLTIDLNGKGEESVIYGGAHIGLTLDGASAENIQIIGFENLDSINLVYAEDNKDGTLKITGYKPDLDVTEASGYIRLHLRFTSGGVTHELWQYLEVIVKP